MTAQTPWDYGQTSAQRDAADLLLDEGAERQPSCRPTRIETGGGLGQYCSTPVPAPSIRPPDGVPHHQLDLTVEHLQQREDRIDGLPLVGGVQQAVELGR